MATLVNPSDLAKYLTTRNCLIVAGCITVIKYRGNLLWLVNSWRSPLRHLPGPKNESILLGNLLTIVKSVSTGIASGWIKTHGKVLRCHGLFGSYQLWTTDMHAANFIMSHGNTFPKSERDRKGLARVLGAGLISADVETHKRQRRIMNPSFGAPQIRSLVPIFCEKSNQLRDIWLDLISNNPEGTTIDVFQGLGRATFDIIGAAGFGYEFHSLQGGDEDELAQAFTEIFDSNQELTTWIVIKKVAADILGISTEETRRFDANIATINRLGAKIIEDKKVMLQHELKDGTDSNPRDFLTLLIKSNMAQGTSKDQSMSDAEVLGQIATFLAAGHESTSTTISWALYALTKSPQVQTKLRQELQSCGLGEDPSMAELEKLAYLDNVVREVLRVYPAVPAIGRQAVEDAVIPVGESYTDRYGVSQSEIKIQKWDSVMVPVIELNRAKDVWGEDADEFRPERWDHLPAAVDDMPGIWGHLMTFIEGPHACIGYRFALMEMKALLYALIRAIEFDIDPELEIEGKLSIVVRPCVKSQPGKGNQMPLICRPVVRA